MATRQKDSPKSGLETKAKVTATVGNPTPPERVSRRSQPRQKLGKDHPWMKWAGTWKDDPTVVPMMNTIYQDRAGEYRED